MQMPRISGVKITIVSLAAALILSGCGGKTGSGGIGGSQAVDQGSHPDTPSQSGKISFTIGYASGDPATKQAIGDTIKAFMQANPDIIVQDVSETSSSAYLDWLKVKDAVGEFPDLVEMRDTEAFADAEKIVPLPDELAELFDQPPQIGGKVWNALLFVSPRRALFIVRRLMPRQALRRFRQPTRSFWRSRTDCGQAGSPRSL